jgi:predicted enzyme related to lactoylglutathione lyase
MATRLENVVIATTNPEALAEFWSRLVGWPVVAEHGEIDVRAPQSQGWPLDLVFHPVDDAKVAQNRIHLDLASATSADQAEIIERAKDLGAKPVDIGQRNVPWEVMADPEGNEFCVLEPRVVYQDAGPIAAIVVQSVDAEALSRFWRDATGWNLTAKPHGEFALRAPNGRGPWLEFLTGHPPKSVKDRLHLDVRPLAGEDQEAEVARLRRSGARSIDIGQGDVPWEVMADPEGNEVCVLTPPR